MKWDKSDYVRRITNATPMKLVVIACELVLEYINHAQIALKQGDEKEFRHNLTVAQDFLQEISGSLNMEYSISWEVISLYLYVNKLFAMASAGSDSDQLDQAKIILRNLMEAWQEVADATEKGKAPIMENSEQVYAGLTYGRSGLNEFVVQDTSRGFQA